MRQGLDVDAFAELVRRTREPLYAYAVAVMWDPTVAEDVVQRAFALAFAKRHTFRPELGSASAWMFGIARHVALDERRRMSRRPRPAPRAEVPERCALDLNLERTDQRSALVAAVRTLDEADRDVIGLNFWGGDRGPRRPRPEVPDRGGEGNAFPPRIFAFRHQAVVDGRTPRSRHGRSGMDAVQPSRRRATTPVGAHPATEAPSRSSYAPRSGFERLVAWSGGCKAARLGSRRPASRNGTACGVPRDPPGARLDSCQDAT